MIGKRNRIIQRNFFQQATRLGDSRLFSEKRRATSKDIFWSEIKLYLKDGNRKPTLSMI